MTSQIKYSVTPYGAYLTEASGRGGDRLTIELESIDDALLKIGENTYKISHGVLSITPARIKDGTYIPELITDGGVILLDGLTFFSGSVSLNLGVHELARVGRALADLTERVRVLEESNRELRDAVFGRKLF